MAKGLKNTGFGFPWTFCAQTIIAMVASLVALHAVMEKLPLGIAYPIWTGNGFVG